MTELVRELVLVAGALLVMPGPAVARLRLAAVTTQDRTTQDRTTRASRSLPRAQVLPVVTAAVLFACVAAAGAWLLAVPVAAAGWFGVRRLLKPAVPVADPLRLATCWDLLAACLRAGLPVSEAVRVIADRVPGDGGTALRATSGLLALGADPADAWRPAASVPATAELARGARRTARSGTELATVASALAAEVRMSANDVAEARAQRAGVLIAGPLGLCFLPAFVCLGVIPVITGLAAQVGLGG